MYTPAQLVAASNLNNNIGLSANTLMTSLCSTITSTPLVSNYAILQPGTTYGNVLASNGFSMTSLGLPEFVANANTVSVSITTQASKLLPNVQKFASLVTTVGSFATSSYSMYAALSDIGSQTFEDISLNITDHRTGVTNGVANIFGGGSTDPSVIAANMSTIASAVEKFGTAYDVSNLGKLGDPIVWVKYLIGLGFDIPGPATATGSPWYDNMSSEEVLGYLYDLVGPVFTRVITLTGIQIPKGSVVLSLGDLLDLSKVFPTEAINLIPEKNFAGLANMFVNLGGKFKSFGEIASLLRNTKVPTLTYLNVQSSPVPSSDRANLISQLGSGIGTYGNPTVIDLLGCAAGIPYASNLSTVASTLSTVGSLSVSQSLVTSMSNLAAACASGNSGFIASNISIVQSSATAFKTDATVASQSGANFAVTYMQGRVALEQSNLAKAGVDLDNYSVTGSMPVIGFVGSLPDYGVDRANLKYNELLESVVQKNVGGDAVIAVLAEGKNINTQSQFSVPITTKLAQ